MSFQWKWLRNFVRRNTNPIPEYRAQRWRQRLSLAYILLAWNAFGLVCYMVYTGRNDWAKYYGYKSEEDASVPPCKQLFREKHDNLEATQLNVKSVFSLFSNYPFFVLLEISVIDCFPSFQLSTMQIC